MTAPTGSKRLGAPPGRYLVMAHPAFRRAVRLQRAAWRLQHSRYALMRNMSPRGAELVNTMAARIAVDVSVSDAIAWATIIEAVILDDLPPIWPHRSRFTDSLLRTHNAITAVTRLPEWEPVILQIDRLNRAAAAGESVHPRLRAAAFASIERVAQETGAPENLLKAIARSELLPVYYAHSTF